MYMEAGDTDAGTLLSAIAAGVNARGGIAGHPLKIDDCNDHNDANNASQCAREAVGNPRMLGIIGNASTCSSQLLPLLVKAQMGSIGDQFFCPEGFNSPNVFPFTAGSFNDVEGSALGIKYLHNPDVILTTVDLPAGREYPPLVKTIIAPLGGVITSTVYIPLTATDLSSYAAQIASAKGILAEGNPPEVGLRLGKALQQQGFTQPVIYNPTVFYPSLIQQNLPNVPNQYLYEYFDLGSAGYQQFLSDMQTYGGGLSYRGGDLADAWLAANVVAEIAKSLPTVSAPSVLHYLSSATALPTFGMTAPLNFTVPSKALGGLIPRAVNANTALYKYSNGTLTQATPFVNLLPGA